MKYLIINTGSASKKYALYSEEKEIFFIHLEKGLGKIIATLKFDSQEEKLTLSQKDYDKSIYYILGLLTEKGLIQDKKDIDAVGIRVVAPGTFFLSHKIVDKKYLKKLGETKEQAQLHITPVIREFEQLKKILPNISVIGVSDSAFHSEKPDRSKLYGLPKDTVAKYEIYRYGYHGISAQFIVEKSREILGEVPPRLIIAHLGGGSSIIAVKEGKSIETSMGFTPLEGLVMATRVGDIDPGAVIYLAQKLHLSSDELENYFNTKCGLLGLSGGASDDIRELLLLEEKGDADAKMALEIFTYRIKKYIGSYIAAINGLDMLVFSATIGERSDIIRRRVCEDMDSLGIILNEDKNKEMISQEGFIHDDKSKVKIAVIKTDEMQQMARVMSNIIYNK